MAVLVDEEAIAECRPDDGRYTLTVEITGEGSGSVVSELDGISCSTNGGEENICEMTYDAGTNVDLIATPDQGSNFDNSWTLGFGSCTGNTSPCQVTMNSDVDLIAHFDLNGNNTTPGGGSGRLIELRSGGSGPSGEVEGESTSKPDGIVAGDQVSVVPFGAPNAGAGGASPSTNPVSFTVLFGLLVNTGNKRYVPEAI